MKIIFESHKTSVDNESGLASGWRNSPLSEKGREQGINDRTRYADVVVDAVFTSDSQRAIDTAELIFGGRNIPTFSDSRLREYNYGDLEGGDKKLVFGSLIDHIDTPYTNGESVKDAMVRMESFIADLKKSNYENVVIIGHRATQLGLEHFINGVEIEEYIKTPWEWQPGWKYNL